MHHTLMRTLLALLLAPAVLPLWAQGVSAAEYFWDNDPGPGNGTAMTALDGGFGQAVEAILMETSTLPAPGPHKLGIRVRDAQQNWGPVFATLVVVDPSLTAVPEIRVTHAEYFWDTDPGAGNGFAMLVFDGDLNSAVEAVMMESDALPDVGVHVLHIRARDTHLAWSTPFHVVVDVVAGGVSFPEIRVSAAEYYWDTDPGPGNGTLMLALDGDFSSAFEALRGGEIPGPVEAGTHVLWLRARDTHGNWGPSFGIVAQIDTTITDISTDVPALTDARSLVLLPNPAQADGGFIARFDSPRDDVRVVLIDAGGRQVAEVHAGTTQEVAVPLHGVASGLYHVGVHARAMRTEWRRLVVH